MITIELSIFVKLFNDYYDETLEIWWLGVFLSLSIVKNHIYYFFKRHERDILIRPKLTRKC